MPVRIEEIINKVENTHPDSDLEILRSAYLFSAMHHRGQKNARGEPFLVDLLEVANILAENSATCPTIAVGLLHATIEQKLTDFDALRGHFGDRITAAIEKICTPVYDPIKKQHSIENRFDFIKFVKQISLLRNVESLSPRERKAIADEAINFHIPLSYELGLSDIEEIFKNLAYPHTTLRFSPENVNTKKDKELVALTMIEGKLKLVSLSQDGTFEFLDSFNNLHNIMYVCSNETLQLQQAIDELEELINNSKTKEQALHEFFEKNPEFILNEKYKRARSKIVLTNENNENLIPDFLLEPADQEVFSDLLELKTPSQKVYVLKKSRMRFSAAVMEACAQLREYSNFFEEEKHRNAIQEKYGLTVYKPRMYVVIGRRGSIDPINSKRIQSDVPGLNVISYDDLITRAKDKIKRMQNKGISSLLSK